MGRGGDGEAGGEVDAFPSHLLINGLDDVIRTSWLTRRLMTLITSSWSLTFDSSDVTNAINCRSHRWKVITPSWCLLLWSCEHGWRYQGHSLNVRWNLNTHPCPPPHTSFTSIFIPAPNQRNQMEYMRNSTINKGFTTRHCGLQLYVLLCHWNVSPRVILLCNDKHGNMLVFRRFVGGVEQVATIWIWSLSVV